MNGWADIATPSSRSFFGRHGIGVPEIVVFLLLLTSCYVKSSTGEDSPAPYDLLLIPAMAGFFLFGLRFPRGLALPISFWALIMAGYGIGGMAAFYMDKVQTFMIICTYLVCSLIFFISYVYPDPGKRLRVIFWGYTLSALAAASIAIAAYSGFISDDLFLEYGRASSTFNDPNVFGPFLIAPVLFLGLRLSEARSWKSLFLVPPLIILLLGLLLSFSRGAWGSLVVAALISFGLTLATSKSHKQSVRLIMFAGVMVLLVSVVLAIAVSTPKVAMLFEQRLNLVQSYDEGEGGRFDSQQKALEAIIANPLGIGPAQWPMINHLDTHNVYLGIAVAGGFLSGLAFIGFVFATIWRGAKACLVKMPGQDLLIVAYAVTVSHFFEAFIIDVDNWRHLFLLMGICWGGILAADIARKRLRDEKPQISARPMEPALLDGFPG